MDTDALDKIKDIPLGELVAQDTAQLLKRVLPEREEDRLDVAAFNSSI